MRVPKFAKLVGMRPGHRFGRDQRLLAAILIISVAAVLGGFVSIRQAERQLLEAEASATAIHWAKFLQDHLSELDEILSSGLISSQDQRLFDFASEAGRVFRYEVIRPDGITALSSWAGDYRKSNTEDYVSEVVATGEPFVTLVADKSFRETVMVNGEAYVPIIADRRVTGVIKVHVDMTERAAALRDTGNGALAALIGLLTVIGGLSGFCVWYNIRDRNRELREIRESRERIARAERTIRALNRRNEMILNAAGEGIYGLDTDGRTTFINPAGAQMIGWEPSELIGKPQHAILHHTKPDGGPYPREDCPIYAALRDGTEHHVSDEVFWRKDGTSFPVEYTSAPIRDEDGELSGAVVVFKDITERTRAERAVVRQAAELARSNAELEQFAYVASHDLQEPLRKIQAFGGRIKRKKHEALGDDGRDHLERMLSAAQRMQVLINDLLTLSRAGTSAQHFVPVDLAEVAHEVVADLEVRIQATGATVEVGDLPTIDADPTQIRQLIQNLISNALKFHRPEERPAVRVRARCFNVPGTSLKASDGAGEVCQFLVEDNGIGFDQRHQERIFAVFGRLHGRGEYDGTGVGLAICRKIVGRHNGDITAEGKPGHGSTFIVTLPVKQERGQAAA
ncbi:MAG: ATP-binding protein [Kiloniellaceae bacterium]